MTAADDGISGTTFDRPEFQRMQKMAENGEIETIIVKDLSRFGREQVEMGRLTQIVYPSLGVTFIAIQENVNTAEGTGLKCTPNVRHCGIMFNRRGDFLCPKEYRTKDIQENSSKKL